MKDVKRYRLVNGTFYAVVGAVNAVGLVLCVFALLRGNYRLLFDLVIAMAAAVVIVTSIFMFLRLLDRLIVFILRHAKRDHTQATRAFFLSFVNGLGHLVTGYAAALLIALFPLVYVIIWLLSVGYLVLFLLLSWKDVDNSRAMLPIGYFIACMGFLMGYSYEPFAVPMVSMLVLIFASIYLYFKFSMALARK